MTIGPLVICKWMQGAFTTRIMLVGVAAFKINKKKTTETLFIYFFQKEKNGYIPC